MSDGFVVERPPSHGLLSDPRLASVHIRDTEEALVEVHTSAPLGPAARRISGTASSTGWRPAQIPLPRDVRLLIVDRYCPLTPCRHATCAVGELKLSHLDVSTDELDGASRCVRDAACSRPARRR